MATSRIVRYGLVVCAALAALCVFSGTARAAGPTSIFGGGAQVSLLQEQSLRATSRDGQYILNMAWPLAFGMLQYRSADLLGARETGSGYAISTRINYLNLLSRPHFLKLTFYYDRRGNPEAVELSGHSDIIAPQNVDPAWLMDLLGFSGTARFSSLFAAKAYAGAFAS